MGSDWTPLGSLALSEEKEREIRHEWADLPCIETDIGQTIRELLSEIDRLRSLPISRHEVDQTFDIVALEKERDEALEEVWRLEREWSRVSKLIGEQDMVFLKERDQLQEKLKAADVLEKRLIEVCVEMDQLKSENEKLKKCLFQMQNAEIQLTERIEKLRGMDKKSQNCDTIAKRVAEGDESHAE